MHTLPEAIALSAVFLVVAVMAIISLRDSRSWRERLKVVAVFFPIILFCACTIAWLIGGMIATYHGGSARDGKIENGIHFVRSKTEYTVVSEETWQFLHRVEYWTGERTFGMGAAALVGWMIAAFIYSRYHADPENSQEN